MSHAEHSSRPGCPVIHVGIQRGASTFLQRRVFPNVPNYRVVSCHDPKLLGFAHLSAMDPEVADEFREFAGHNVIISQEDLLFHAYMYMGRLLSDPRIVFANLNELYGRACKILLVIRRQDTAIDSMIRYKQRYLSNPRMYLMDYPVRTSLFGTYRAEGLYGRLLDAYNYYRNLFLLLPAFGKDNIHVLLYEDLIHDPVKFFADLGACFGEDLGFMVSDADKHENVRSRKYDDLTAGYVPMGHLVRKLNNLSGFRLEKLLPKRSYGLPPEDAEKIMAIFAPENSKLDELFGLRLARYGYY